MTTPPGFDQMGLMKEFPKPPSSNRDSDPVKPTPHPAKTLEATPNLALQSQANPKLELYEVDMILKTTLTSTHYHDPKVIHFIKSYLNCRDIRQAAKESNLTYHSGRAARNSPDVQAAIQLLTEKAIIKDGLDVGEIIEKVKEIMQVDIAEFQNPDGSYKNSLIEISPETRRAIKKFKVKNLYDFDPNGVKVKIGELIEVELWDKMKSIELLGREKGIFKETKKIEHDVTANMKELLLESRKRAETAAIESRVVREVTPVKGKDDL